MPATLAIQVSRPNLSFSQKPAPADGLHVSLNGNDTTGDGSHLKPFRTIYHAMAVLPQHPGLRAIFVGAGSYEVVNRGSQAAAEIATSMSGSANDPCWLLAEPGVRLVAPDNSVIGSQQPKRYVPNAPFIRVQHDYWIIDGFEFDGGGTHWLAVFVDHCSYIVLRNLHVHHFTGTEAISFYQAQNVGLFDSLIRDSSRWEWWDPHTRTQFVLRPSDLGAEDCHGVFVNSGCTNILIKGNESCYNGGDSVQCNQEDKGAVPNNITIEENRFHHDFENAIDLKTCSRVAVRANKIYGYRERDPQHKGEKRNPRGTAIVVHVNASDILFEHNRIWNSTTGAIFGASNGMLGNIVFRRNLIFDASAAQPSQPDPQIGFGVYASHVGQTNQSKIEIYNNTFYNIPCNAMYLGINPPTDEPEPTDYIVEAVILNNIIMDAGWGLPNKAALRFKFYENANPFGVQKLECNHNLYFDSGQPSTVHIETNTQLYTLQRDQNTGGVTTNGQSGWGSNHQFDLQSYIGDPAFVPDPRNNDFYTLPGSPARDRAAPTPGMLPICGNGPDIGFLESCT